MTRAQKKERHHALMRRRFQALELRKIGLSYAAIGATLNVCATQAAKDVKAAIEFDRRIANMDVLALRLLESDRIDTATTAIAAHVKKGDLAFIDRWLKLSEARRKLLGIDAVPSDERPPRKVKTPVKGPKSKTG